MLNSFVSSSNSFPSSGRRKDSLIEYGLLWIELLLWNCFPVSCKTMSALSDFPEYIEETMSALSDLLQSMNGNDVCSEENDVCSTDLSF